MLTETELMALHIHALFTHDTHSRLLSINEPGGGGAPAPRMFLGRTRAGNIWRFRADLPENLVQNLVALCSEEPSGVEQTTPRHLDEYIRLLETHAPVRKRWMGPAYHVAEYLEPSWPLIAITESNADRLGVGFEDLIPELPDCQPFIALVAENRTVSVCRSVRITPAAHEAGVETLHDCRGKGYAKDVVAGWARSVQSLGVMPLYSTSWDNTASQKLAKKLRLSLYGVDFHVT